MKIHVTAEDIADGLRNNCAWCPVAIAIKRAFHEKIVTARHTSILIGRASGPSEMYITPANVSAFMAEFDATGKGQPFTFDLEL